MRTHTYAHMQTPTYSPHTDVYICNIFTTKEQEYTDKRHEHLDAVESYYLI